MCIFCRKFTLHIEKQCPALVENFTTGCSPCAGAVASPDVGDAVGAVASPNVGAAVGAVVSPRHSTSTGVGASPLPNAGIKKRLEVPSVATTAGPSELQLKLMKRRTWEE